MTTLDPAIVRAQYLACAAIAVDLLSRRQLGERWDDDSVLADLGVGALAAHLGRAVLQVEWFLDMPEPGPPGVSAAEYYAGLSGVADPASDLNVGVRARAMEAAAGGWARLYIDTMNTLERLGERLGDQPVERRLLVFGGRVLAIDQYLLTRLVELVVHIDDLSRSIGVETPVLPPEASGLAISVLVNAARANHGDRAVLHALARRELDTVEALRVL